MIRHLNVHAVSSKQIIEKNTKQGQKVKVLIFNNLNRRNNNTV